MRIDFQGGTAVVTGGARGIGHAICERLRAAGADTHSFDRLGADAVDVTDERSLSDAFDRLAVPEVVVVNAGVVDFVPLEETTLETWQRIIDVNLKGAFLTVREAARRMKPARRGAIVLTASTNSWDGEAMLVAYNASKAGVLGILHTAANELGPYGIRVNAVCPGLIRTPLTEAYFERPNALKNYFQHIPMGRGGEPEEVANVVAFLASDLASYMTGAAVIIDGGQLASKYAPWTEENAVFDKGRWRLKD